MGSSTSSSREQTAAEHASGDRVSDDCASGDLRYALEHEHSPQVATSALDPQPAHSLPSGLRLTAADRPGIAQPVPERDIPDQPWRTIALTVAVLLVLLTALWEWQMRRLELVPGDVSGSLDTWAEQRRSIDHHPVPVVLVGDSRILFDTDLDRVAQLTGVRPIQLGIPGGTGLPVLEDLADDPHFNGLAITGMAEGSFFDTRYTPRRTAEALKLSHWESPAKRASFQIQRVLSRAFAMLDGSYQLSTLVVHLDPDWRPGVRGPYHEVWKIGVLRDDGQMSMWSRIEHDPYLSSHARGVWHQLMSPMPLDDSSIHGIQVRTKLAVDKIRARGGDVVFLRPPSAPDLRTIEESHLPKAKGWVPLLTYAHANGVHIDDLPAAQNLTLPEGSHLTRACATVFTDAYIRAITERTPLLHLQPNPPAPLSTRDCTQPAIASLAFRE